MSQTILEHLIERLRQAAIYNRHDLAPPTVVLWTDGEGLWSPVIPLIREAMPELLVLAAEVQGEGAGPSTWVRYQLARRSWAKTPVLYLPGVARQAFRGAAGFPETARHLFALQFQGQFWSQLNGKDWTPAAFLASDEGGLGLDLARDRATLEAVSDQLAQVLRATREALAGRRLEAPDFHALAAGDPVGFLLEWMGGAAAGTPALRPAPLDGRRPRPPRGPTRPRQPPLPLRPRPEPREPRGRFRRFRLNHRNRPRRSGREPRGRFLRFRPRRRRGGAGSS
jgi:hypothetical protein